MISKEQYGEWRNHPATMFFRRFLKDRRETLIRAATENWLNSPANFKADADEARGRILELFDVEDVAFERIENFYQEKEQEANAAKDIEAGPR